MTDFGDPDFVPSGGGFCLKWSPWFVTGEDRTATLAYVARNYVGFRRVTIQGTWLRGRDPTILVEKSNSVSICTFLSADAFVEWEDAVSLETSFSPPPILQSHAVVETLCQHLLTSWMSRYGRRAIHKWPAA